LRKKEIEIEKSAISGNSHEIDRREEEKTPKEFPFQIELFVVGINTLSRFESLHMKRPIMSIYKVSLSTEPLSHFLPLSSLFTVADV
jgi:hypothetical protein